MTKKNVLMGLLAMIIAIISLATYTSCKDHEEEFDEEGWVITYPKTENYDEFDVTNISGEIIFDDKKQKYLFSPDNPMDIRKYGLSEGDDGGESLSICLENDSEKLKEYVGKVTISGIARLKYAATSKHNNHVINFVCYHYSLKITSFSSNKTRSVGLNEIEVCGTPCPTPPAWIFGRANYSAIPFIEYQFRVFIHIVRSSTGEGYTASIGNTIINTLNSYYKGSNLSFLLYGTDFIDEDKYNLISKEDAETGNANGLFTKNPHSNAIDIYVISSGKNLSVNKGSYITTLKGIAEDIISTALLINSSYYGSETVAHEVGHCLGLYHTHTGTGDNYGTPELVNGSNSAFAGDYITDTPADPNKWNAGTYTGGDLTDANGDKYNPDPLNLMSYSGHKNRGKITAKQCERIYESITNTKALQMTCSTSIASISGPQMIASSATYSVNVSEDYDVTWNIMVETFTSKTTSTKTYMSATGNSFVLKNPNANATSQKYTIIAKIKNKKGVTFQLSKMAYHVIPSATTGTFKWASELTGHSSYNKMGYLDPGKGDTYNTVSVYQNGDLYFYYTDACGVNTYNNSYFNFVLNDNYSNFTKYSGGYHAYKCKRSAGTGSYSSVLQVLAGPYSKLIPIKLQILQYPFSNDEEPKDSLEILKTRNITKYIRRL